jgi:hypothetical protein
MRNKSLKYIFIIYFRGGEEVTVKKISHTHNHSQSIDFSLLNTDKKLENEKELISKRIQNAIESHSDMNF